MRFESHTRIQRTFLAALATALAVCALFASLAQAVVPTTTSGCPDYPLSQPFASIGDLSWYTLAPGQTVDNFNGAGWTLSGGASVKSTTLANGAKATVLDMPAGSKATSPAICVTRDYPLARMMARNIRGTDGVGFYVSYLGTSSWVTPLKTDQVTVPGTDWSVTNQVDVNPYSVPGGQTVKFGFKAESATSRFQIYNVYIDPYRR